MSVLLTFAGKIVSEKDPIVTWLVCAGRCNSRPDGVKSRRPTNLQRFADAKGRSGSEDRTTAREEGKSG